MWRCVTDVEIPERSCHIDLHSSGVCANVAQRNSVCNLCASHPVTEFDSGLVQTFFFSFSYIYNNKCIKLSLWTPRTPRSAPGDSTEWVVDSTLAPCWNFRESPCRLHAHSLCTPCPLPVHSMYTPCSPCPLHAHSLPTPCALRVHSVWTPCGLRVDSVWTPCGLRVHSVPTPWRLHGVRGGSTESVEPPRTPQGCV